MLIRIENLSSPEPGAGTVVNVSRVPCIGECICVGIYGPQQVVVSVAHVAFAEFEPEFHAWVGVKNQVRR